MRRAVAFLAKWGTQGYADGQFKNLIGVAVDASGNVYVLDSSNYIQNFTSGGAFLAKWGSTCCGGPPTKGAQEIGDGQFNSPSGIAVDATGNVYVTDYANNRVQKFTSGGAFLAKWGTKGSGDGQFSYAYGVAVDASGNVYVAEVRNARIQVFASGEAP